jgi:hypothetical protein
MRFISSQTWRTIRDSFQTFVIAFFIVAFAILLTFLRDFAVLSKRPAWLANGIELLSVLLFVADGLMIFCVCIRIAFRAVKDFLDDVRKD